MRLPLTHFKHTHCVSYPRFYFPIYTITTLMQRSFVPFSTFASSSSSNPSSLTLHDRPKAASQHLSDKQALDSSSRSYSSKSAQPLASRMLEKAPRPPPFHIESSCSEADKSSMEHFTFPHSFTLSRDNADLDSFCQSILEHADIYRHVFISIPKLNSSSHFDYILLSTYTVGLLCLHDLTVGGSGSHHNDSPTHFYKLLKSGSIVKYGWADSDSFPFPVKPYMSLSLLDQFLQYSARATESNMLAETLPPEFQSLSEAHLQAYSRRSVPCSKPELFQAVASFFRSMKEFRALVREPQPHLWPWLAEQESHFASYYDKEGPKRIP